MIRNRMIARFSIGLSIAVTVAMPTSAEVQQGWYFGVSPGQAEYDIDKGELDTLVLDVFDELGAPISGGSSDLDDEDTTWSISGGYRFSPYLAVEAGYVDLGTAEYRASGTVQPIFGGASLPATFNADFESKGITLAGVASAPLGEMFDVHARLGMLFADSEVTLRSTVGAGGAGDSISANSKDLFYGVGAAWHLGENWSVSLDWQQYKDVGKEDETDETDINSITLGISYRL